MTQEQAKELLHKHRIEKLLDRRRASNLKGMITIKDIEKTQSHPQAAKDKRGPAAVCAAAVGVSPDLEERVAALSEAGVDLVVIDTAHGHSKVRC